MRIVDNLTIHPNSSNLILNKLLDELRDLTFINGTKPTKRIIKIEQRLSGESFTIPQKMLFLKTEANFADNKHDRENLYEVKPDNEIPF